MLNKRGLIILLILFSFSLISSISSDNYAINSQIISGGGSNASSENYKTILSSGEFSGNVSSSNYKMSIGFWDTTIFCGDSICDSTETCSSCSSDCGCSSGYSCSGGVCVMDVASSSSSSGGGGAINSQVEAIKFSINPELFEDKIILGRIDSGEITITNDEDSEKTFSISSESLEDILVFEESIFTLSSGESRNVEFRIYAPKEAGVYAGKIVITSGFTKKEILVIINVWTEKSLFDITMNIPKSMKTVGTGKNINVQINLLQMGMKEKMDVTLNYLIKDFDGKIYLTESETIAVYDKKSFDKELHTLDLSVGNYVVGVELIYPDGVAVASSQFKIEEGINITEDKFILGILTLFFAVIILGMWITIKRYKKRGASLIKKNGEKIRR